jgi:hypothetical protein
VNQLCGCDQKVLLAVKSMGGDSAESLARCSHQGQLAQAVIIDGTAGLEKAVVAMWNGVSVRAPRESGMNIVAARVAIVHIYRRATQPKDFGCRYAGS